MKVYVVDISSTAYFYPQYYTRSMIDNLLSVRFSITTARFLLQNNR